MAGVHPQWCHRIRLGFAFDAFSDELRPDLVGEFGHGCAEGTLAGGQADASDEAPVKFDGFGVQVEDVAHGGKPCAGVIHCYPKAAAAKGRQGVNERGAGGDGQVVGQFQHQPLRGDP